MDISWARVVGRADRRFFYQPRGRECDLDDSPNGENGEEYLEDKVDRIW